MLTVRGGTFWNQWWQLTSVCEAFLLLCTICIPKTLLIWERMKQLLLEIIHSVLLIWVLAHTDQNWRNSQLKKQILDDISKRSMIIMLTKNLIMLSIMILDTNNTVHGCTYPVLIWFNVFSSYQEWTILEQRCQDNFIFGDTGFQQGEPA